MQDFHENTPPPHAITLFLVSNAIMVVVTTCEIRVRLWVLNVGIKAFNSPTDAQVNCLKNNFKIYVEIDIKTAPTFYSHSSYLPVYEYGTDRVFRNVDI
jgi:hypothetical protein